MQLQALARRAQRKLAQRLLVPQSQCRKYSIVSPRPAERIEVASGAKRTVSLDVHSPLLALPSHSPAPETVLLYFPRGPLLPNPALDEAVVLALRSTLPCHIVQVNSSFDETSQHPHQIYDAVAAFDWAVETLLPRRSINRVSRSSHVGRVATCGELLGGSLATMLSLTECRAGYPGVVASAVSNPLTDWIFPEASPVSRRSSLVHSYSSSEYHDLTFDELRKLRGRLFGKPENYFDPFASPILFFRSSGHEVPRVDFRPQTDEFSDLDFVDHDQFNDGQGDGGEVPLIKLEKHIQDTVIRRRTSRQFPSRHLGLRLPAFNITSGSLTPFAEQAHELTQQLRKSIMRQSRMRRSRRSGFGEKMLYFDHEEDMMDQNDDEVKTAEKAEAEKRILYQSCEGSGLWDDPRDGQAKIHQMAQWLRGHLLRS